MKNIINKSDMSLIRQPILDLGVKVEILNDSNQIIGTIQGHILDGSFDIDSEADIRRTCSLTLFPDKSQNILVSPDGFFWLNKAARIYLGIKDMRTRQYVWYNQGCYDFQNSSSTYDAASNTLSISCCDYTIRLNGSKGGNLSAPRITIPAYEQDKETGEILEYHTIRDSIITVLEQLGGIHKYKIEDIGEQNGLEAMNADWETYRKEHPLWNTLPYDFEFSSGSNVFQILCELRDLYPNYEMFFDTDSTFICQRISNCDEDDIVFDNRFFQDILISEDFSLDLSSVKNVCEVWGETLETDRFLSESTLTASTYHCTLDSYTEYTLKEKISVSICTSNPENPLLQINDLAPLPIYEEATDTFIASGALEAGKTYTFRIDQLTTDNTASLVAYLLGEFQPHAVTALVDGSVSSEIYLTSEEKEVPKYSPEYFKDKYQCNCVSLIPAATSPYTVQKIGELLAVKSGTASLNISSDSLALEQAEYENWKNCRLTDTITIKTKIVPFADIQLKCSYRRTDQSATQIYLVKSVSHNFTQGTTTWTLYRHYPSLKTILENAGTYEALMGYPHTVLNLYTHKDLTEFLEGGIF